MVFDVLKRVLRKPTALMLALLTSIVVFVFATWLPNIRLIISVLGSENASFSQKLELPVSLIGSIVTNFSPLAAVYTVLISILIGINVALLVESWRRRKALGAGAATSAVGVAAGIFGLGCAACGSLVIASLIGAVGGASALAFLPLRGGEFGLIGVILSGYATYFLAQELAKPLVCEPVRSTHEH